MEGSNMNVIVKKFFFVGLKDDDQLELGASRHCSDSSHCEIIDVKKSVDTEKAYSNIQNLKETLLYVFGIAKDKTKDNPNAVCGITVHGGRAHYWNKPGSYIMSDLVAKPQVKYERLSHDFFAFKKIERLPVVRKIIRYDYRISTPAPITELRYKVYLCETEDEASFLTCEEAGMGSQAFPKIRTGPGYFCKPRIKVGRIDVVDPTTNYTTRLNIQVYTLDDEEEALIKHHSHNLEDAFKKIKVINNGSEFDLTQLELPDDYLLTYYRRSERNEYQCGSTNFLCTSKEIVFVNNNSSEDGEEFADVFFMNEIMNGLLKSGDWTVEEVVDCFENILKFSDTMMQYLM